MTRTKAALSVMMVAFVSVGGIKAPAQVVIETVPIGNPRNAADTRYETRGVGGVDYVYKIGKFEVTAEQYTAFLNAVAAEDAHYPYHWYMAGSRGCNIQRAGSSGGYTYTVPPDWADRPVNYVPWGDAARFCNWLHNGQPTGAQDLTATEDGSYYLNGMMGGTDLMTVVRKADATWVIPSEGEWYKAAYHKNDGVTGNYFTYPTSSDNVPYYFLLDPDPGNNATFYWEYTDSCTIGEPYWRTEVGAHENSASPYTRSTRVGT